MLLDKQPAAAKFSAYDPQSAQIPRPRAARAPCGGREAERPARKADGQGQGRVLLLLEARRLVPQGDRRRRVPRRRALSGRARDPRPLAPDVGQASHFWRPCPRARSGSTTASGCAGVALGPAACASWSWHNTDVACPPGHRTPGSPGAATSGMPFEQGARPPAAEVVLVQVVAAGPHHQVPAAWRGHVAQQDPHQHREAQDLATGHAVAAGVHAVEVGVHAGPAATPPERERDLAGAGPPHLPWPSSASARSARPRPRRAGR